VIAQLKLGGSEAIQLMHIGSYYPGTLQKFSSSLDEASEEEITMNDHDAMWLQLAMSPLF
jgi:hypothetical protein